MVLSYSWALGFFVLSVCSSQNLQNKKYKKIISISKCFPFLHLRNLYQHSIWNSQTFRKNTEKVRSLSAAVEELLSSATIRVYVFFFFILTLLDPFKKYDFLLELVSDPSKCGRKPSQSTLITLHLASFRRLRDCPTCFIRSNQSNVVFWAVFPDGLYTDRIAHKLYTEMCFLRANSLMCLSGII